MANEPVALSLTEDEMKNTLGVLFIGYVLACMLYGFNFFQTWRYSSLYPSDPITLKGFVATVCLLDLGTVALVSHALYIYLIQMFPKTIGLVNITTTFSAEILLALFGTFLVQSYYVHHLWRVHKKPLVAVFLETITSGALALGIVDIAQNRDFQALGLLPNRLEIASHQALVLFTGLSLAIMQWRLPIQRATTNDSEERDLCDKFVLYFIRRFTMANATQLGYLIVFVTLPQTAYWLPFHLCSQKLYVNAFLNELNSRPVRRRRCKGDNSHGDLDPSRPFMNSGVRNNDITVSRDCEDSKVALQVTETFGDLSEQEVSQTSNKCSTPCVRADISSKSKTEDRC